ncbi:hypothetical protein [Sphingomonas mesophila]|uniref:hypothetical protein n=1 Tax=Sphingomonas mesophila TaxID=2303576 RepID=UPI0013C2B456|nr:hypothetical protein [Sphingomonas mesophila]
MKTSFIDAWILKVRNQGTLAGDYAPLSGVMGLRYISFDSNAEGQFTSWGRVSEGAIAETTPSVVDLRWFYAACHSNDASGVQALGTVIDGVNMLINLRAFRLLDSALRDLDAATTSKHVLLGIARATYPARSKLSGWKTFIAKVDEAFRQRGLDSARLLRGLHA